MISFSRLLSRTSPSIFSRRFANAFLGNELQRDLRRLYLLVHPDMMAAFPESVKNANKGSLQVGLYHNLSP